MGAAGKLSWGEWEVAGINMDKRSNALKRKVGTFMLRSSGNFLGEETPSFSARNFQQKKMISGELTKPLITGITGQDGTYLAERLLDLKIGKNNDQKKY